jgi:hypothetical protein
MNRKEEITVLVGLQWLNLCKFLRFIFNQPFPLSLIYIRIVNNGYWEDEILK